ncbi:MAG: hypothetical protein QOF89_2530 [Acidobacteriota bacterium]|jgi:hypothetical protein|nr:hypothetical protein [Acidobacteriota bacterium]
MATSSATIAVNFGSSLFLTLVSNVPTGTVTASGTGVSLLPQSTTENQFNLTFQAGSGVRSVNGIAVTSISSSSVSVTAQASGGVATANCFYASFLSPAPTANFTLFYTKQNFEAVREDPTITFNPPSGGTDGEIEEAPMKAEEVLV